MKNYIINTIMDSYRRFRNTKLVDMRELYKYWEQEHLKKIFNKYEIDCVFDVGANLGQYAQMLRKNTNYKGLIISFEPIPNAALILKEKSKNDPNWIIIDHALSSKDGHQTFNIMSGSQFSSLSTPNHNEVDRFKSHNKVIESVSVVTETLESAYTRLKKEYNFKKPFLKLDTQGYDVEIVTSSKPTMTEFIGFQSELSIKKIYQHSMDFREAITIYQECGFSLSAFVPNNEGHFPILIETDCIMIRDDLTTA